jgi:hypothetical protein
MDMDALAAALNADGLVARVVEPTPARTERRVAVVLEIDGAPQHTTLEVVEVPADLDDGGVLELVQLLTPLPLHLSAEATDVLARAVSNLDRTAALPGFGVDTPNQQLYHRHIALVPHGAMGLKITMEAVWLVRFTLSGLWSDILARVSGHRPH